LSTEKSREPSSEPIVESGSPDSAICGADEVAGPLASLRVLLAEDDEDNGALLRRFLVRAGAKVDLVTNGLEAQERIHREGYDVVVSDISMPGMDGLQLLRWIRERESAGGQSRVPVIMVTAHDMEDFEVASKAGGADAFLTKPVAGTALCNAVIRAHSSGVQILVVDDNGESRRLLCRQLADIGPGIRVVSANGGEQAMDILAAEVFDAVLLDLVMTGIDGHETARRIRGLGGYQRTPIIACTAHSRAREWDRCQETGFTALLTKPIGRTELSEVLKAHLGKIDSQTQRVRVAVSEDILDLVPSFLTNRRENVVAVRRLVEAGSWDDVRRIGHGMKGTGGAYGFDEISTLGASIEAAAEAQDSATVLRKAMQLEHYLQRIDVVRG